MTNDKYLKEFQALLVALERTLNDHPDLYYKYQGFTTRAHEIVNNWKKELNV